MHLLYRYYYVLGWNSFTLLKREKKDISVFGAYLLTGCNWPFWAEIPLPLPLLRERKRHLGFRSVSVYGLQLAVLG